MDESLSDSSDCMLIESDGDDHLALDEAEVRRLERQLQERRGPRTKMQEELHRRSRSERVRLAKELAEQLKKKEDP